MKCPVCNEEMKELNVDDVFNSEDKEVLGVRDGEPVYTCTKDQKVLLADGTSL